MRAEECSGTQEGGNVYHVFAGKTRNSCLVYKVNLHGSPFLVRYRSMIMMRRSSAGGSGKGAKVVRRGSSLAIKRSARCCVTSTELLRELGHPGYGAGTLRRGALIVANGNCTQNSISAVKIFRVFRMRILQQMTW